MSHLSVKNLEQFCNFFGVGVNLGANHAGLRSLFAFTRARAVRFL